MNIDGYSRKKEIWTAFWRKESLKRPLLSITSPLIGNMRYSFQANDNACARVIMGNEKRQIDYIDSYKKEVTTTFYGGEAIPYMNITLGPDQYASFIGAEINIINGNVTTWVKSCVESWNEFNIKLHDDPDSYLSKILKFINVAAEESDDRYIISMLDIHSNMDALSALRSPQKLCFDLVDQPDEVHTALDKVNEIYPIIYDLVYNAGGMNNTGTIGWAPIYCPACEGRFAVVQCDFSCLISPEHVREYVVPSIKKEASYLDHCVYHYDGKDALRHIDDIIAIPEIDIIQWVPGEGQPRSIDWINLLKKIQLAGKGLWIFDWTAQEIIERHSELSSEGLIFSTHLPSRGLADEFLDRMGPVM